MVNGWSDGEVRPRGRITVWTLRAECVGFFLAYVGVCRCGMLLTANAVGRGRGPEAPTGQRTMYAAPRISEQSASHRGLPISAYASPECKGLRS